MKEYRKPTCLSEEHIRGIVPLVAAIGGMSIAEAALAGAAAGLALSSRGGRDLTSISTKALNRQELIIV